MTAPPDDQLASATSAMREAQTLERQLGAARLHAEESAARAAAAEGRLGAESRDVDKLESLSLTKIWAHLKGSHADDLVREAAERECAEYDYLTQRARADADQRHVEYLTNRIAALGDVRLDLERALNAKEQWLRDNDGPGAARLIEIASMRGRLTAELAEMEQASAAGQRALQNLRSAAAQLDSARSWSAYDTWFDGGLIASMVKEGKLDGVAASLRSADTDLKRFSTELADVHMEGVQLIELSSFTRVFDVWFDNFFTDFAVRDRIIEAQEKVDQATAGIKRILGDLDRRTRAHAGELNRLAAERADLLA
ncbi:hypothetical protein [Mycolicibacterium senegalense]|uniref:Uncharacterized protein n=2 Tax=Mycolicibacterium TaxID=1866885 RepID=A0A378W2I7_9MYCO|nr:hypothetical protein [Mycolicibacterium senegalense]MCV7337436.1 hypothetical protein [Mycolicibacterium senegalense]MDR7289124.1 molecular chaperone GrpE (heat shock protein) [Mycolicibacterium senegalense]QZA25999.1 hypothetical protein K3U95_08045 [Mycolicibacterium senegalense]SUA27307.1 Uncharacterised protein [Mycolicibacterium senegalense]